MAFFAVYDGHGGTGVANYLKDHLHEFILDQPEYKEGNMEESALKAFMQVSTRHILQLCIWRVPLIHYKHLVALHVQFNVLLIHWRCSLRCVENTVNVLENEENSVGL